MYETLFLQCQMFSLPETLRILLHAQTPATGGREQLGAADKVSVAVAEYIKNAQ
jgi:hypothetical protein